MKKRITEQLMSLFFLVVGITAIFVIQTQSTSALRATGATTFRSFPTFCGALTAVLSMISLVSSIAKGINDDKANAEMSEPTSTTMRREMDLKSKHTYLRVAGMFILTFAFAILLKKIHFLILVSSYLFLSFVLLGRRRILQNLIVSISGTGIIYLVFVVFLKLSL